MPKRDQGDESPGDQRRPFSDAGGPAGRHAQTHDVRRDQLTNPKGPQRGEDEFAEDLRDPRVETGPGHPDETFVAADDKEIYRLLPDWDRGDLDQLPVLEEGTRLEQGGVYIDLRDRAGGPFKALGSESAERPHLYLATRDLDYERWNRLTGGADSVRIERPAT